MNASPLVPTTWTTGTTEVFKTGTWRAALPKHIQAPSPCHAACPVNGDIAEWIGRARARDFRSAWDILTRHNPFPAVAGRICHHPCEAACNRAGYDGSLAICRLERYVGDRALEEGWTFSPVEARRNARVAVVGGGPSGLSAAFHLRRRGYAVTLFESRPELGGLMRYGIPSYRLARSVLDGEIARIVALGVDVRCGESLETAEDFERLRAGFDAVYLAIGARCQKRLPRLDYSRPWVVDGADYLASANAGVAPALGRRVVVIGGGSAAIDVARSARRAGHEVTILALESMSQMPAQRDEVAEALEEGIALVDGAMLTDAIDTGSAGLVLKCVHVNFEAGATLGQFTVTPVAKSEFTLDADAIVPSIGQDPDLAPFTAALESEGALVKADQRQATSAERVYAGGDVASMARFVTEAIGMGKRAAHEIDRVLRSNERGADGGGVDTGTGEVDVEPVVELAAINTFYYPPQARAVEQRLPAEQRLAIASEVQIGFDLEHALAETERCFSCGTCIECDNCVHYCPDLAVKREADGYVVLTDYCKGCGLCVKECPTGSMKMIEDVR
jgi:NADPH-dependent glutamate synthase beta subunit-like oxidoreductase/Pyruvate/2-oxoacid:ferredoxin oxidoreductase delta subunit